MLIIKHIVSTNYLKLKLEFGTHWFPEDPLQYGSILCQQPIGYDSFCVSYPRGHENFSQD